MQTDDRAASFSWDEAGQDWQPASTETNIQLPQPTLSLEKLAGSCGRAFACTCGTGGGFLASHAGCIASPTLAFMTASSGVSLSMYSVATSAALTAAGLSAWWFTRGKKAGRWEKNLTVGGALTGAVMAASLHLTDHTGHHKNMENALAWYQGQSDSQRAEFAKNAHSMRRSIIDYVLDICGQLPQTQTPLSRPVTQEFSPLTLDK